MKTSAQGKIALAVSEGLVDTAYLDSVGVWTIGIGHTASAGGINPKNYIGKKLTVKQVLDLFAEDLPKYEAIVTRNVKVSLKQNEFDALVHFVYNIGEPNFKKSNLLKNLNAGNKKLAFENGFHGWLKPPELKGRRDFERDIALNGKYGSTVAPLYTANTSGKLIRNGTVNLKTVLLEDTKTPTTDNGTTVTPPKEETSKPPANDTKTEKGIFELILEILSKLFKKD